MPREDRPRRTGAVSAQGPGHFHGAATGPGLSGSGHPSLMALTVAVVFS